MQFTMDLDLQHRDIARDANDVAARLAYFQKKEPVPGSVPITREAGAEPWPGNTELPEINACDLTVEKLRSAMARKGCLIVRDFFDAKRVDEFKSAIDQIIDADLKSGHKKGVNQGEFNVFSNPPVNLSTVLPEPRLSRSRGFHRSSGSVMAIESSSFAESLIEWYDSLNLRDFLESYLGEPPCLSALKWVLRRSKLPISADGWHQDGAFMGSYINSLNLWVPLDTCGGKTGAPGLDIIPKRFKEIVNPGEADAALNWSTGNDTISGLEEDCAPVSPEFNPGDVIFFDHFLLHRTQYGEDFGRTRYAIETWFFGSRNFPKNQVPLRWDHSSSSA
jgi:hypothetical protein